MGAIGAMPMDVRFFRTANDVPPVPGAYVLAIDLAAPAVVRVGRNAPQTLPAGRYLYCGSAKGPGGLKARLARHMRRRKPVRWHVDRLTARGVVIGAWIVVDGDECALAATLRRQGLLEPIPGFGSSDCRSCASHLFAGPPEGPDGAIAFAPPSHEG